MIVCTEEEEAALRPLRSTVASLARLHLLPFRWPNLPESMARPLGSPQGHRPFPQLEEVLIPTLVPVTVLVLVRHILLSDTQTSVGAALWNAVRS